MELKIRTARKEDAAELLSIYAPYVENTAVTFECAVPTLSEFESRVENTLIKYPYIVAELDGEIMGYSYAGPFKPRAAYEWSVELSVYVKEDHRKIGVGKSLYEEMERLLSAQNIVNLNVAVAYSEKEDEYLNHNSIEFHEHMGYSPVGRFEKCANKFGRWYDLVWLHKSIGAHIDNPPAVIPFSSLSF